MLNRSVLKLIQGALALVLVAAMLVPGIVDAAED